MAKSSEASTLMRIVAGGALAIALSVGTASAALAADEHAGGTPPPAGPTDPGAVVLGETLRRDALPAAAALPRTGTDVGELVALGLGALAVGSVVVAGSRRRAAPSPA